MKELVAQRDGAYPQDKITDSATSAGTAMPPVRPRARLRITGAEDIERALELAALVLQPDEISGRELVRRLMPQLFMLRKKGFSYLQLTRVINDAIGKTSAQLQPHTVKAYYHAFIAGCQVACEAHYQESLPLIAEIKKLTEQAPQ
ncbi:MAG: hypothetical protein ABI476_04730 [Oxalobacteraceae bacterium]